MADELTTTQALQGALMWLRLICEAEDIDPADTRVNFSAVHKDTDVKRPLGTVTLAECLALYDTAIAREVAREII